MPIFSTSDRSEDRADEALLQGVLLIGAVLAVAVTAVAMNSLALPVLLVAGAGAYFGAKSHAANESRRDVRVPLQDAWLATLEALGETGFVLSETSACGPTDGRVRAGDATVTVERHPGGFSRVRVRIGVFDTEDHRRRAALILEAIANRIG
jgi:hypothetical protein